MARKKGNWFSTVKKALSPESKAKKDQRANKSKNKWFRKHKESIPSSTSLESAEAVPPIPTPEEVILGNVENEEINHYYPVVVPTAAATEIDSAAADEIVVVNDDCDEDTTVEIAQVQIQPTIVNQFDGKSKEKLAAIKIQTAFRGYLARRALRALRGLVRLTSLVQGPSVKRQAANTLRCMQTLSRVQSQIRSRRIRMSEENQALHRQILQKNAKELENLQMGDEWDDSHQSKEQIETSLLNRHEAAMRRERAMAYAFSHQQTLKNSSSRTPNPLFMDPSNPTWGWSWLERWMAARPWESKNTPEKEPNTSVKNTNRSVNEGEISKAFARHQLNSENPSPKSAQKVNPPTRRKSTSAPTKPRKLKPASPRGSKISNSTWGPLDDDSESVQSEVNRRHSIAGSSVRDDESLASSTSVPSYMVPTESARARLRMPSPLGPEKNGTPEKSSVGPAKKRLSYPASPALSQPRRHSGPPKMESSSIADVSVKN